MRTCLEFINQKHRNCEFSVIGDLNNNYNNQECSHVKSLKMLEILFEMKQLIKNVTWCTLNSKTLIDLYFMNIGNISSSGVIRRQLSDHSPIFNVKKKLKLEKKVRTFSDRCYRNWSIEILENELDKYDWSHVQSLENPNHQWNIMYQHLLEIADYIYPIKNYCITIGKEDNHS